MDFLNKAFAQLTDLFRSMTPGARITSGLLLAVVVIGLGYLVKGGVSGTDGYLMGGRSFPPDTVDNMVGAFAKAGLSGWQQEGNRIRIPTGQETKFIAALVDNDAMPRDFGETVEAAIKGGSVFESREKFNERLKNAKEQRCSQVLGSVSWIAKAAVQWDAKAKQGFNRGGEVITATASIKPLSPQGLTPVQVQSIRSTVTSFVAGLQPENVTVLDLESGRAYRGDSGGPGAMNDNDIARKQVLEEDWKNRILGALSYVPGITVATNVDLDPTVKHHETQIKNDPKTVPIQTTDKSVSKSQDGAPTQGRPGYASNRPMAVQMTSTKGSHEEEEVSQQTTVNAVSGSTQEIERQPLPVKRVTATIGVPASYFEQIWQRQNPPDPAKPDEAPKKPTQADLEQIRQKEVDRIRAYVAVLLPEVQDMTDKKELVKVESFQDIPSPSIPGPGVGEQILTWLEQSWKTIGLLLLAAISLVMLRSMMRSAPVAIKSRSLAVVQQQDVAEQPHQPQPANDPSRRLRRFQPGMSLKDEVALLVNDDPDAAANILRTWIGHPS